jgi:putative zinc finger/helix-turn-helix YgiT family protein
MQIGVAVDLVDTVEEATCQRCGEQEISFPDFNGLMAAIAVARVKAPIKLTGNEIRFLRKALEKTAKELAANIVGVRQETISRWENNKEQISPPIEKLLRIYVMEVLGPHAPGISVSGMELLHMRTFRIRDPQGHITLALRYGNPAHTKRNQGLLDFPYRFSWR